MGNFSKSLSKEFGKNTGKWVSNKVFGTGHSTPHKIIIQQERSERKVEREKLREEKSYYKELDIEERRLQNENKRHLREQERAEKQKEIEERRNQRADLKAQKEAEIELKRWLKEQDAIEKEIEIEVERQEKEYEKNRNFKLVHSFNEYIDSLKTIHKNLSYEIDWNIFLISEPDFANVFKIDYIKSIEKNYLDEIIDEKFTNLIKQACYGGLDLEKLNEVDLPEKRPIIFDDQLYVDYEDKICEPEYKDWHEADLLFEKKFGKGIKIENIENLISKLEIEITELTENQFLEKYSLLQIELEALKKIEKERNVLSKLISKSESEKNNNRILDLIDEISKIKERINHDKQEKLKNLEAQFDSNKAILVKKKEIDAKWNLFHKKGFQANSIIEKYIKNWDENWVKSYGAAEEKMLMHYLANNILNRNVEVYNDVLKIFPAYDIVSDYGSSISINYHEDGIEIDLFVNINDVVPQNKKTITKEGKLSELVYTFTERNLLIQDYVCSMVLRIARETFSIFCCDKIIVNSIDRIINKSTGKDEDITILSVFIERQKVNTINFDRIDSSDCIENLEHSMNFNKSQGFSPVANIPNSKLNVATNLIEKVTINAVEGKSSKKELSQSIDTATEKEIIISASMTVSELKVQIKTLFSKNIEVYTTAGNVAGDGRKLRALTDSEIKGKYTHRLMIINDESLEKINVLTGLTLKLI